MRRLREEEERGTEAGRRWQQVAGMVMGRCTQACFQLHSAHMTSCTHGAAHTARHASLPTHGTHCSHPGPTHAESERPHFSALPATDTRAQATTCSITHRQPLPPCPPLPSPSAPQPRPSPSALSWVKSSRHTALPLPPQGLTRAPSEAWGMDT